MEIPEGWGFPKTKEFKEMYEAEFEFPEGWGALIKIPSVGRYGYYMELHIAMLTVPLVKEPLYEISEMMIIYMPLTYLCHY